MNGKIKPLSLISVVMAVSVLFSGCNAAKSVSTSKTKTVSSSAASKSDSLSSFSLPYTTVTNFNPLLPASKVNMALWPLMYDCLSEPDQNYNPIMRLADSITSNGTTVTIKLKSGIKFTDGTTLSAKDVIYTFKFVQTNTNSPYNSRLANVTSYTSSGNVITLTLKTPDPLIANMLDIPIIKANSDSNGNAIGTGRFKYSKNGVNAVLERNPNWYNGTASKFSKIDLVNIPSNDAIMPSLSIGETNFVYSDDGSGSSSSATNTKTCQVNINQMVYIGINSSKTHLDNNHFRRALSYSIDRNFLVTQYYSARASGCALPFNPKWSQLADQTKKGVSADFETALSEMQAAGNASGISLTLLVNQENTIRNSVGKYLVSCFNKIGINVTLKSVPFDQYNSLIQNGDFDMYLGEIKLANDMDISPLLASGGSAAFKAVSNSSALAAFNDWRNGTHDIKSAATALENEMPFIPLCFRTGTVSYTKGLSGVVSTDNDLFFNFEKWN